MTDIAIPIFLKPDTDLETVLGDVADTGASLIELRCDHADEKILLEALDEAPLPVIVTVRPTWEGGYFSGTESKRLDMLEAAMEAGADYVDIELLAWEKSAHTRQRIADAAEKSGTRLILSNHSFGGRPADLPDRLARLQAVKAASICKLVWKAESILDATDALHLTQQGRGKVLALAMGEEGLLSRLLAAKFAAPFTFASLDTGKESAPGQPTVADLLDLYRFNEQTPATPVFGVIGWPVGHSLSPHVHNAAFAHVGVDAVYVPLAIRPEYDAFKNALDRLRSLPGMNFSGASVTIPHKENALRYARENAAEIDPLAESIGVVNTLLFRGKPCAMNTDYAGALDALVDAMNTTRQGIANTSIAVLGAGGAARAIVAALAACGAHVTIYNRTFDRAAALAAEFTGKTSPVTAAPWESLAAATHRVIINTTPLGMHPKPNASPIDFDPAWNSQTVVFDMVYNPLHTKLLKMAENKNAKTVTGLEMFVRQAAIQFRAFVDKDPPIDLFRNVMLERLRSK